MTETHTKPVATCGRSDMKSGRTICCCLVVQRRRARSFPKPVGFVGERLNGARRDAAGRAERARPGAMDDARGFRKVPASVPDLLRSSPRSSRELGWQRRKLVLGALVASIFAVALLRVGVRPTRASDRLAAEDPWDYLDDTLAPDDALAASASRASDRLLRLGRAGRAPSAPRDRPHCRATARLHVTRDPTTGDLIMNDVGVGAFAVTQPSPCKPIGTEADGEPVAAAFVDTRTRFRAGKSPPVRSRRRTPRDVLPKTPRRRVGPAVLHPRFPPRPRLHPLRVFAEPRGRRPPRPPRLRRRAQSRRRRTSRRRRRREQRRVPRA